MVVYTSLAVSIDGYMDDDSSRRLILSSTEDWTEVHQLRAVCDAILVGAQTVRQDNPALVIRDENIRKERAERELNPDLIKVTISKNGRIDPHSRFFSEGIGLKVVFVSEANSNVENLRSIATVIVCENSKIDAQFIINKLTEIGVKRLMIEGGCQTIKMFLDQNKVDYLRYAVAPFSVGPCKAAQFRSSDIPSNFSQLSTYKAGTMSVNWYLGRLSQQDNIYINQAIELAHKCPLSKSAYSVGAVITTTDNKEFTGYSRETDPNNHAEEEALLKAKNAECSLENATIYSSMEPCTNRKSKEFSCSRLIIESGIKRVVFALYEPSNLAVCSGEKMLLTSGVEVVVADHLQEKALQPNRHITSGN